MRRGYKGCDEHVRPFPVVDVQRMNAAKCITSFLSLHAHFHFRANPLPPTACMYVFVCTSYVVCSRADSGTSTMQLAPDDVCDGHRAHPNECDDAYESHGTCVVPADDSVYGACRTLICVFLWPERTKARYSFLFPCQLIFLHTVSLVFRDICCHSSPRFTALLVRHHGVLFGFVRIKSNSKMRKKRGRK